MQASFIAASPADDNNIKEGTSPFNSDPIQSEPHRKDSPIKGPDNSSMARMYYVLLSAPPGTEEARVQRSTVTAALTSLQGRVILRHEFGQDEDDVINVISFKLDGGNEGLEEVVAIYPVVCLLRETIYSSYEWIQVLLIFFLSPLQRTRKRPEALPLGSLAHKTQSRIGSQHDRSHNGARKDWTDRKRDKSRYCR